MTLGQALSSPKVITLSLIYFGFVGALYGMQFWLPQIVKAFGFTNAQTGFVTAIPYLFGTIAMILWARHSDATRERVAHVGGPLLLTAVALGASSYITDPTIDHDRADDRGDRRVLHLRGVLDAADRVAVRHRGGRRDRADQFDRQPRRLRRAVSDRLGQGRDRQHLDRVCWCCRCCRSRPGLLVFLGGHDTKTEFAAAKLTTVAESLAIREYVPMQSARLRIAAPRNRTMQRGTGYARHASCAAQEPPLNPNFPITNT